MGHSCISFHPKISPRTHISFSHERRKDPFLNALLECWTVLTRAQLHSVYDSHAKADLNDNTVMHRMKLITAISPLRVQKFSHIECK